MMFFVLATGLHALLFFGINFGIDLNPVPRLADTLDVVLVQWRSEEAPAEADYLAQVDQTRGGDTVEPTIIAGSELVLNLTVSSENADKNYYIEGGITVLPMAGRLEITAEPPGRVDPGDSGESTVTSCASDKK